MKKSICLLLSIFGLIGCKSAVDKSASNQVLTEEIAINPYFTANGNEPFWNIKISEIGIEFKSLVEGYEKFNFTHVEPIRAMDANVKMYKLVSNEATIDVQIFQKECTNSMSGEISKYTIKIDVKKANTIETKQFEGYGKYSADYRLTDIWVLEDLKGKKVATEDFARELPMMEINAEKNNFFGYAGCNRMNGTLFSENKILRFTNIITTKMACLGTNKENDFLKALQSTTSYNIENNRLYLSNSYGEQLVFKKID
jgi:heat shock protein HslJ/uncharacterized membrane protein